MLRVGIFKKSSSSFDTQSALRLLAVDIWEKLANNLNLKYKYINIDTSFKQAKKDLNAGKYDIIVGPYIISSRLKKDVDFTEPWYVATYAIATYKEELYLKVLKLFLKNLTIFVAFIFFSMLINSFMLKYEYANELKTNLYKTLLEFTSHSVFSFLYRGLHNYMPKTPQLKFLFWFYAVLGFVYFAFLIASFVELFREHFVVKTKLPNKPTLVSANSPSIPYLRAKGGVVKELEQDMKTASNSSLIDVYMNNRNDYLGVFGFESSQYSKIRGKKKYKNIDFENYNLGSSILGFILPKQSQYKQIINQELLRMRQNGDILAIGKERLPYGYLKNLMTTVQKKDLAKKKVSDN